MTKKPFHAALCGINSAAASVASVTGWNGVAEADAKALIAEAEARKQAKILEAEGEARLIELEGKAKADALQLQAAAIRDNPELIEFTQAQNWNGQLPQTILGNAMPFLDVGGLMAEPVQ